MSHQRGIVKSFIIAAARGNLGAIRLIAMLAEKIGGFAPPDQQILIEGLHLLTNEELDKFDAILSGPLGLRGAEPDEDRFVRDAKGKPIAFKPSVPPEKPRGSASSAPLPIEEGDDYD